MCACYSRIRFVARVALHAARTERSLPSGVLSGWLKKRGGGSSFLLGSTKYQARWFVLDTEGTVRYYKTQPTKPSDAPKGRFSSQGAAMHATSATDFEVAAQSSIEGRAGAPLSQQERIFYLRAESTEARDRWLAALQTATSGARSSLERTGTAPTSRSMPVSVPPPVAPALVPAPLPPGPLQTG